MSLDGCLQSPVVPLGAHLQKHVHRQIRGYLRMHTHMQAPGGARPGRARKSGDLIPNCNKNQMVSDRGPGTPVLDPPEGPDLAGLGKVEISYQIIIKTIHACMHYTQVLSVLIYRSIHRCVYVSIYACIYRSMYVSIIHLYSSLEQGSALIQSLFTAV